MSLKFGKTIKSTDAQPKLFGSYKKKCITNISIFFYASFL